VPGILYIRCRAGALENASARDKQEET